MNTRLDTDPELLDLVRAADPMRDPRVQANAGLDTESALRLLAPELDLPPAPRRVRRRRRTALRVAVARRRGRGGRVRGGQRHLDRERLRGVAGAGADDPQACP